MSRESAGALVYWVGSACMATGCGRMFGSAAAIIAAGACLMIFGIVKAFK